MSDQTKIQTVGPADPNAPKRSKSYALIGLGLAVIPVLVAFNVLTEDQAASLIETYSAVGGLAGAFGLGLASLMTRKQVDNGTFEQAPAVPVLDAFQAVEAIKAQVDEVTAHTQSQVAASVAAIQGAAAMLPGGGLVGGLVTNLAPEVSDLIRAMTAVNGKSD